jgi:hypothetical protein
MVLPPPYYYDVKNKIYIDRMLLRTARCSEPDTLRVVVVVGDGGGRVIYNMYVNITLSAKYYVMNLM